MNNNEDTNNNLLSNLNGKIKKINLQIQLNPYTNENDKKIKLPYLAPKKKQQDIENKKNLRRKLVQIGNFCQSIYNSSNPNPESTPNKTKTMEDLLNDTKLKAIEEIKNDFFINQSQAFNKEDNTKKDNNNKQIYRKIILSTSKPKSLKKITENNGGNNNNGEEKFTYLTTTYERNPKKENRNNFSIDNITKRKIKYNYADYASNKLIINHPRLYILNSKRENTIDKLPLINRRMKKINVIKEFSKIIPDKLFLSKEEKRSQYDEYMKAKELKNINKF